MKISTIIPFWKTAPFTRLLFPLIAGILIQWYCTISIALIIVLLLVSFMAFIVFYLLPLSLRFRYQRIQGIILQLFITGCAIFLCWQKDIRHRPNWYGKIYTDSALMIVRINEPPVQKAKTIKAEVLVEGVVQHNTIYSACGKMIVYFSKDSTAPSLGYGDKIIFSKALQPIKSSGNPGAFDYKRYAGFQQLYHTAFLKNEDYQLLHQNEQNLIDKYLFRARDHIISVLQKNLPKDSDVTGIAEALLIGYKTDLDKDLVQAYSNAGVVHIIAISGLHLGLIYVLLVWLLERTPFIKRTRLLKVLLILGFLWIFSLLTGASASVLRSAVMFTCIIIGKNYFRQASIYNSLAASAFLLLCYDPCFLWDVGFQLSYLAVYGIVWLQKPIYHAWYIKNKWLNKTWEMAAVTIAAQLITFPVCIFYFHQFPNLFLLTNLLAVPLSTIILFVEIVLLAFSWIPFAALLIGKLIYWMIVLMNYLIIKCNALPFSLTDNIYATPLTTFFLYAVVLFACGCWLYKKKWQLHVSLNSLLILMALYSWAKITLQKQQKIIVYNIPKYQAVDFIYKDQYFFKGDSSLLSNGQLQNFHLKPARISMQLTKRTDPLKSLIQQKMLWQLGSATMLIIDSSISFEPARSKIPVDILLVSKNPRINISGITNAFRPSIVVFDGSNSLWKIAQWKKECEQLLLRCFSVADEGAYMLDTRN